MHNFVENNSINSIDPFGLSPIASNIDRISNALHDSVDKLNGSPISKALNLPYVVGLLSAEIYNFPVVFYPVIKDADAQFSGGRLEFTDEIGSDPVAKADTILHELVHARNARLRFPFVSRFGWGSREDEGMAYGLQLFLTTVVPRMDAGYGKITESGCNKVKISQAWKSLWSGDQASKPITDTASWLKGYYFAGNFAFIGDETDLSRMRQYLGINFGCEKIASLINKTLSENNCSFRVTCKKNDDNCFLIGSGAQITGEWAK